MRIVQFSLLMFALACVSCNQSRPLSESDQIDVSVEPSERKAVDDEISPDESADAQARGALALFNKRILPILQSKNPSSCSECHLSGVDLKAYILPTQEATFASLVSAGLIDREKPDASKLLEFIRRSPEATELVSQKVREEELAAFRDWIRAAVKELTSTHLPELIVLSYNEITRDTRIESVAMVSDA